MMEKIESPVARAAVRWRTPEQGGRRSGPPTAPVYMATAVFVLGEDSEVQPGWPQTADQFSILLQKTDELQDERWDCIVGVLAPDLVVSRLYPGIEILVLEGRRTVASVQITEVYSPSE